MNTPTDDDILKLFTDHRVLSAVRESLDPRPQVLAFARAVLAAAQAPKPRSSDRTRAALAEVAQGAPVAPTARKYGIQPSTLFRARARVREAAERPGAATPSRAGRRSGPRP